MGDSAEDELYNGLAQSIVELEENKPTLQEAKDRLKKKDRKKGPRKCCLRLRELEKSISYEDDLKNALDEIWRRTGTLLLQVKTRLDPNKPKDLLIIEALNSNQQTAQEALFKVIK